MISLSSALSPVTPPLSVGPVTAAPPGDFVAALAGVIVPDIGNIGDIAVPVDRQIAAAPGNDLPVLAVGDTLTAPAETVDAPRALIAPSPDRPAAMVAPSPSRRLPDSGEDIGDARDPVASAPLPVATDPEMSPTSDGLAGHQASGGKRMQMRKEAIATLPLPIPVAPAMPVVTATIEAHETVAPPMTDDDVAAQPDPALAPHIQALVVAPVIDPGPTSDTLAPVRGDQDALAVPASVVVDAMPRSALPIAVPIAAPVPAHAIEMPEAAPAELRPPRFVSSMPVLPVVEAGPGLKPGRVGDAVVAASTGRIPAGLPPAAPDSAAIDVDAINAPPRPAPGAVVTPPAAVSAASPLAAPHATPDTIVVAQATRASPARPAGDVPVPSGPAASQPLAPRDRPLPARLSPAHPVAVARPLGPETPLGDAAGPMVATAHASPVAPPVVAVQRTPLDMRHDDWTRRLIDRIDRVRDIADAADTRIKLVPDALGKIDVAMRKDGDTLHVTFTADTAQTRAMLAEAQPRLAELAAQRGLRLGQASVDAGTNGQNPHQQQSAASPAPPPSRRAAAPRDEGFTATGRVA